MVTEMTLIATTKPLKNPVSITANLLLEGLSVYLKADGTWSPNIADSAIAYNRINEIELLNLAQITTISQLVLGAYSFDVKPINGKATPIGMRETIRAKRSPTIKPVGLTEKIELEHQYITPNATQQKSLKALQNV